MRSTLIAVVLSLAIASPAFADIDHIPGPAPIDEDVANAYRLCEANYRTIESYAGPSGVALWPSEASSFPNKPRYRLAGCNRVFEIYEKENEERDKQFIDFVTGHYTGDPRPPPRPPLQAAPELHGLTPPK